MKYQILALDFDGVICDALNECILVTWNGYYDKSLDAFSSQGLATIPEWFIQRFSECRNFAKHLGHFAVSIFDRDTVIKTQGDFERVYLSLDPVEVETFVAKVNNYRALAAKYREADWLAHHTLYPGVRKFLASLEIPLYIVSAKDEGSIKKILANAGIYLQPHRIFGERRKKLPALEIIQDFELVTIKDICFVDDNIMNVIEAKQAGYGAYWADWGYSAPAHIELAKLHGVTDLTLQEFVKMPGNQPNNFRLTEEAA
jgi:phosphoglycolate phosphatase-like HAD superfamily hydrolase